MENFTEEQIENWKDFKGVRDSGVINMLDSRTGCDLTGMTKDEWGFCIDNYGDLEKVANC